MTSVHAPRNQVESTPWLRISAVAAPVLLLFYGLLRLVDGLDGEHGPGLAWDIGHTMFFVAFLLFGVMVVGLRHMVPATSRGRLVAAGSATVAGLFGVAAFLWVILGDLSEPIREQAPLPDPLYAVGPLLFQLGVLTLLVQLAVLRPRRLPPWSPVLVFLGFVPIAVNLDLLPLGALLILAGLAPLARRAGSSAQPAEEPLV
jgi:hypothetical protein